MLGFQDHYDWGLRAIKSVLVVAGSLKREDQNRPEDQVLSAVLGRLCSTKSSTAQANGRIHLETGICVVYICCSARCFKGQDCF